MMKEAVFEIVRKDKKKKEKKGKLLYKKKSRIYFNYWKISVEYQIKFVKESTMKRYQSPE